MVPLVIVFFFLYFWGCLPPFLGFLLGFFTTPATPTYYYYYHYYLCVWLLYGYRYKKFRTRHHLQ